MFRLIRHRLPVLIVFLQMLSIGNCFAYSVSGYTDAMPTTQQQPTHDMPVLEQMPLNMPYGIRGSEVHISLSQFEQRQLQRWHNTLRALLLFAQQSYTNYRSVVLHLHPLTISLPAEDIDFPFSAFW